MMTANQSPISGKFFTESPNFPILIKMLYADDILNTTTGVKRGRIVMFENERKQIEDYLKMALVIKKQGDRLGDKEFLKMIYHHPCKYIRPDIKVKYHFSRGMDNLGRVYPEKSQSLGSMRKEIRHQLCRDIYVDVDIVNAHFVIAAQLFKTPLITDYVENRTKYFDLICDAFTMGDLKLIDWRTETGYELCKGLMIRELYFGKWEGFCKENGLPAVDKPVWLFNLEKEFQMIAENVKRLFPDIETKLDKDDCENPNGTIVSWYLQDYERRILEKMVEFFKKKKMIVKGNVVLCFDGLQVLYKEGVNWNSLLKEAEVFVSKEVELNIQLKVKPFDNGRYTEKLNALEIPYADDETDTFATVEDDQSAGVLLLGRLEDRLKYSQGQVFFKSKNIWTGNALLTKTLLITYIQGSNVYKLDSKGNSVSYAQNYSNARNIYETLIGMVKENPTDGFYKKLHTSTIGMLCFEDGVLDITKNTFHLWDALPCEVFSCVQIDRPFEQWFLKPNQTIIDDLESKVIDPIMGYLKKRFMNFVSRAFAGHYLDKDWGLFIGNRNCGKGTLDGLMKTSLGCYKKTIPSDNLLCERGGKNGDVAKAMSWAIDLQWVRLATTQEIQIDNDNKNVKLNSVMVKKLASGGDDIEGRKNYQDEMTFQIDAKILMMANDICPTSTQDINEFLVEFKTTKQFKDARWIEYRTTELNGLVKSGGNKQLLLELDRYVVGNDDVKFKCDTNVDWANAFISLLVKYYIPKKLVIEADTESNGDSLCSILLQKFKITGVSTDFISNKTLKEDCYVQMGIVDSYKKMRTELASFNGVGDVRIKGVRGLTGLIYEYDAEVVAAKE